MNQQHTDQTAAALSSIPLQKMRVLVACRGPIAYEVLRVIHDSGMPRPDIIISRYEWFDTLENRAPWLIDRSRYDVVHCIEEYSDMNSIIRIALERGLHAVYVGYGFLAENADFAQLCEKNGLRFVGPDSEALRLSGDKERARRLCQDLDIPVIPGVEFIERKILIHNAQQKGEFKAGALKDLQVRVAELNLYVPSLPLDLDDALEIAMFEAQQQGKELFREEEMVAAVQREISQLWEKGEFPVRIKARAGGGGKGQRVVRKIQEIPRALREVWSEIGASRVGGNKSVILERNLMEARHLEVQILGDGENFVHFGVRDCSLQTMFYQKLIEIALHEGQFQSLKDKFGSNSPLYHEFDRSQRLLQNLQRDALRLVRHVRYRGAGTVEFLVDDDYNYYFMEVNARIQVEHGVSEEISRIHGEKVSLVREQLRIAAGEKIAYEQKDIYFQGYALEVRVSLLDSRLLQPAPGAVIERFGFSREGARIEDSGIEAALISRPSFMPPSCYDANIALNIYSGEDWEKVLETAINNLRCAKISGRNLSTTIPFHIGVLTWLRRNQPFPRVTTAFVESYLILLATIRRQLVKEVQPQIEIISQSRQNSKPWQRIARDLCCRVCAEPNLAAAFSLAHPHLKDRQALEVIFLAALHSGTPLWPEDYRYFEEASEFFQNLRNLCNQLNIPGENPPLAEVAKAVAEVENVRLETAMEALKTRIEEYGSSLASLIHQFLAILSGLDELKREEETTRVVLPASLRDPEMRHNFLKDISSDFITQGKGAVVSPILGIFYRSPKPGVPPFVEVGQSVQKGQTLCLVGAMKVYTEVLAPCNGTVKEILVEIGTLVKLGQALMILETAE